MEPIQVRVQHQDHRTAGELKIPLPLIAHILHQIIGQPIEVGPMEQAEVLVQQGLPELMVTHLDLPLKDHQGIVLLEIVVQVEVAEEFLPEAVEAQEEVVVFLREVAEVQVLEVEAQGEVLDLLQEVALEREVTNS